MYHKKYESIDITRRSFEEYFETGDFYNRQTQDDEHLDLIIGHLKIESGMKILDLGTGTGYLAFALAKAYPEAEVTGLDIVEKALKANEARAKAEGLNRLQFRSYDGVTFPFADNTFDLVTTRYALHHFPAINDTFREISRVLKHDGILFLSDPPPNDDDAERFVDAYMQMKHDGHIKFYTKCEWQSLGLSADLVITDSFETHIRFPKKKQTAAAFEDIVSRFDPAVIDGYDIKIIDDEIWITEKVNNLLFKKTEQGQLP